MPIMDICTLSDVIVAHRRAIAFYRKEYLSLGRNAFEVMLYAFEKSGITASDISRNLLHSNISQTKNILSTLVSKSIFWSFGEGVKNKPKRYQLTEYGHTALEKYMAIYKNE